eukprot:2425294-Alexandrium_andersonii.AAC.1
MGAAEHRRHRGHRQQPHLHASGIHHGSEGTHACPGSCARPGGDGPGIADPGGIGALATASHAVGNP